MSLPNVYFFGWPALLGGAETKFTHTLALLHSCCRLTVVPPRLPPLRSPWRQWLADLGITVKMVSELPQKLQGWGVALCLNPWLSGGLAKDLRQRGLRLAWSNEVMWLMPNELGFLAAGLVDALLYVSPAQRRLLEPLYVMALTGRSDVDMDSSAMKAEQGFLPHLPSDQPIPWFMMGNYIDPMEFPFLNRTAEGRADHGIVIGRLSRAEPAKYPLDFPASYESLGVEQARFRVMAWSEDLAARWPQHHFDHRWELLPAEAESTVAFLHSLDLFVYDTSPKWKESWGRAVVEAMLCGVVPLVPADPRHHLRELVPHGKAGFHCATPQDWRDKTQLLATDAALRQRMSQAARRYAVKHHGNAEEHRQRWLRLFES